MEPLLSQMQRLPMQTTDEVDNAIQKLNDAIKSGIENSVPKVPIQGSYDQRLPAHILNLISQRNRSNRRWIRHRILDYYAETKRLNLQIQALIFEHRNRRWNSFIGSMSKSSSHFWNITKMFRKKNKTIPTLKDSNAVYTTNSEKAEVLALKFNSTHEASVNLSDIATKQEVENSIRRLNQQPCTISENYLIDELMTTKILGKLKKKKAPGKDNIPSVCLKNLPKSGVKLLTRILNACLRLCYFPRAWKIASHRHSQTRKGS